MRAPFHRPLSPTLRAAALMPLAALVTHQLRYYLAFGAGAHTRLAADGHGYLSVVEPFALLLTAAAAGALIGQLTSALRHPTVRDPRTHTFVKSWAAFAAALLALYCGQELIEGMVAAGHPAGIAGVFGHGGLLALPIALVVGGVLALAARAGEALIRLVARLTHDRHRSRVPRSSPPRSPRRADWRLDPRSGVVAGRAPPLPAV